MPPVDQRSKQYSNQEQKRLPALDKRADNKGNVLQHNSFSPRVNYYSLTYQSMHLLLPSYYWVGCYSVIYVGESKCLHVLHHENEPYWVVEMRC